jgi:hypothetical protein
MAAGVEWRLERREHTGEPSRAIGTVVEQA